MTDHDERVLVARAYLSRVCEPGTYALWAFVEEIGPIEAAAAVRSGTAPEKVLSATSARRESTDAGADLDAAQYHGIRLVTPESAQWPHFALAALLRTAQPAGSETSRRDSLVPPIALWVKGPGQLTELGLRSVGVVGSRAATAYGQQVAADLAYGLAARDVTVVSGGAYGIDAVAHRAALAANGRTVIVSAGGIDRPYPPSSAALFDRAAAEGLVISEYPPGCAPHRSRFLVRNRLIAAFSTGVLVVEAALRSGARNTAGYATDLGRPLMVVPGPVTSSMSEGCHDMLRNESCPAILVTCLDDVLAVVGSVGEGQRPADRPETGVLRDELDRLDDDSRRVFDGLMVRRYLSPPDIARRVGVDLMTVIRALPGLEVCGLAEVSDLGYRLAKPYRQRIVQPSP